MKPLWTKKDLMSATSASDPSKYFLENVNGIWGISINDRTLKKGDLFIALKGDKFNGHDFIENAIGKGAHGIIVSDKKLANKYNGLLVKCQLSFNIRVGSGPDANESWFCQMQMLK